MKIIFDGANNEVVKEKGMKAKKLHDHSYTELENGVWIKAVLDGSYYDEQGCLWLQAYEVFTEEHEDEEYERFEATGLYFKVGY